MPPDTRTAAKIDLLVDRVLADAGITAPPVRIDQVLQLLRVDQSYYDLSDPGFLRRLLHKVRVHGDLLSRVIDQIRLQALWLPDRDQILVDATLPAPKKQWALFHDASHRLLPWHREFFLGDTAQTLDPAYQEMLETEANYSASRLMFCGASFTREACELPIAWASVESLKRRYQSSYVTALRRFVEHGPDCAMIAVVSTPPWLPVPDGQLSRYRHVIPSNQFAHLFGNIAAEVLGAAIDAHASYRKAGPVGDFEFALPDRRGETRVLKGSTFFNQYDLLTLIGHGSRFAARRSVRPSGALGSALATRGLGRSDS